jgi:hypothetical protein
VLSLENPAYFHQRRDRLCLGPVRTRLLRPHGVRSICPETATIIRANVGLARDEAVAAGITVNGLVILTDERLSLNREHTNYRVEAGERTVGVSLLITADRDLFQPAAK